MESKYGHSVTKCFLKLLKKWSLDIFYIKLMFFKIAKKVTKYLGYFCKKL